MFLKVDPSAATPVYVQIVDQVKHAVASGLLQDGDRLPSIRELAKELRVNPNTIIHAYRELEVEKVIESRKGQGSYVTGAGREMSLENRQAILATVVDRMLVEAFHLNLTDRQVLEIVKERMREQKAAKSGKEVRAGHGERD